MGYDSHVNMKTFKERLNDKTKIIGECLVWTGSVDKNGYGLISYLGKKIPVHRAYYQVSIGQIPTGKVISHTCKNKLCIKIDHFTLLNKNEVRTNGGAKPRSLNEIKLLLKKRSKKIKGCLIWQGSVDGNGYPNIGFNGKYRTGHRLSYEIHKGQIPPGLLVCHTCDVRRCINPDHLFLGTHKDNSQDAVKKGRIKKNDVKLTLHKVNKIRSLYQTGKYTHRSLGTKFKVSKTTIWDILQYNHWIPKEGIPIIKNTFSRRKLNIKDVQEIRQKYSTGKFSQNEIAKEYQVSQTCIWEIISFRTWKTHSNSR